MAQEQQEQELVQLQIKNPGRNIDHVLAVSPAATVVELQRILQREYEGNPEPKSQTVRGVAGARREGRGRHGAAARRFR